MNTQYNLYGNSIVWHNLVNDCLTKRLAHAYIFAGPKGIGKALTANEFIKYILKADEILSERIDEGEFLDLLYITKEDKSEIGIDKIRNAAEFFRNTPSEGVSKFVIIDSADDLNRNAANALLKILEEPTKNTYLFLISHTPYALLSTIRSRCRMIKFQPLSNQDLKLIAPIASMEDFIAGSAARALVYQNQAVEKLYNQLLELIQSDDIISFNKFCDGLAKNDEQWQLVTELLFYMLNRIVKVESNVLEDKYLSDVELDILPKLANNKSVEEWFKIYDELLQSLKQTEIYNLDRKQILLVAMNAMRN
jgi:DNA polymerase-3 subunit delta'